MTDQELAELILKGMRNTVGAPARAISAGRALYAGTPKDPNTTYGAIKPDSLDYIRGLLKSQGSSYRPPQLQLDMPQRPEIPQDIQAMLKSGGYPPHPISETMSPYTLTEQPTPAPTPVAAPTPTSAPLAPEQFKPMFDLAKLIELTQQAGSTMDISGAMREPANSMASILGVNDASYLKGLMPDEVFKLAQTRAENSYKAMLTKQQALNIANDVTGRTTQQELLKSLIPQATGAAYASQLAVYNQNRQDRRAVDEAKAKGVTVEQLKAGIYTKLLSGKKLTPEEEVVIGEDNKININTAMKGRSEALMGMQYPEGHFLRELYSKQISELPLYDSVIESYSKAYKIDKPTDQNKAPEISGSTSSGSRFKIKEVK